MKFFLVFGILGVLFFILGGYMHEATHQEIYTQYNIPSRISIDFPNLVTIPERACKEESCNLAHNLNEVVSYNLDMIYLLIFSGFMCIIFILELNQERINIDVRRFE